MSAPGQRHEPQEKQLRPVGERDRRVVIGQFPVRDEDLEESVREREQGRVDRGARVDGHCVDGHCGDGCRVPGGGVNCVLRPPGTDYARGQVPGQSFPGEDADQAFAEITPPTTRRLTMNSCVPLSATIPEDRASE